jgi:hypothetical protein
MATTGIWPEGRAACAATSAAAVCAVAIRLCGGGALVYRAAALLRLLAGLDQSAHPGAVTAVVGPLPLVSTGCTGEGTHPSCGRVCDAAAPSPSGASK